MSIERGPNYMHFKERRQRVDRIRDLYLNNQLDENHIPEMVQLIVMLDRFVAQRPMTDEEQDAVYTDDEQVLS